MSSPSPPQERQHAFAVTLTVYSTPKQSKGGKTTKQEKSLKTKELFFTLKESNYIKFLLGILEKHGKTQYEITNKQCFPFKFVMPKAKGQCIGDAMDVNNESDYKAMVQKILNTTVDPGMIKIFVDMKHVKKLSQVDGESGDEESGCASCLMAHETHKNVQNEHNSGLTYVGPSEPLSHNTILLSLQMVLDWARALEEGQAMLHILPNMPSFDIINKAPLLHPAHKVQPQPQLLSSNTDVSSLTLAILLQTLANSSLLSQHLGVYNTTMYELDLRAQCIGPHILAETDDKMLSRIGIAIGNIICLKKGSMVWWNGPDAKWKRSNTGQSNVDQPQHKEKSPVCPPPKKRVAYEKKYHDGSGSCFMGPLMQADGGDDNPSKDYNLWYQSVEHGIWLAVPKEYMYWL
ncbi:hypothetical protein V8E55_002329 [Tylopilus felleus]